MGRNAKRSTKVSGKMSELLLELFSEEVPARMQQIAIDYYSNYFRNYLDDKKIAFNDIKKYFTPRRLTIYITGLAKSLTYTTADIRGPKVNAPAIAIDGFCSSAKIDKSELKVQNIKGIDYYIKEGKAEKKLVKDLLKEELANLISSYTWPKSMYWGDYKIKWIRPLHNILCLFDGEIIDFKYGHLTANNKTWGHRLANEGKEIIIENFDDYLNKLEANSIIISYEDRKKKITEEIDEQCQGKGRFIQKSKKNILSEVTDLVEYPKVLKGRFDEKFLVLPSDILVTSMENHQKYFSLEYENGKTAPYFLFVANVFTENQEILDSIIAGNEKVLTARLSDALYFYNQDLKQSHEESLEKLDKVIFHNKLGSLKDKVSRLMKIVVYLNPNDADLLKAADICKDDIVSETVGEFPNLQGIMGYYYAKEKGLSDNIAETIRDHYKPLSVNDSCPSGNAALLSLANKIDSLCGLILAGERATGSKDPHALRRLAISVIKIILDNRLDINLKELIKFTLTNFESHDVKASERIVDFIEERLKNYFENQYSHNMIAAFVDLNHEPNLVEITYKLEAFKPFMNESENNLVEIYKRVSNIISGNNICDKVDESLFEITDEKDLFDSIKLYKPRIESAIENKAYDKAFEILETLKNPLANFFDKVMVKVENKVVADNRISILTQVKQIFDKIANFEKI